MKKIVALLLAAALLLGMTTALAGGETKEITWQDIPWEIGFEEAAKLLVEKGVISSTDELMKGDYYEFSMMGVIGSFLTESGMPDEEFLSPKFLQGGIVLATNRHSGLDFTYGGYPVRTITLVFTPDDKLMSILITPESFDYGDLTGKLTSVYGEPSIEDPFVILGGNRTALTFDWNINAFVYGKTTWDEVFPDGAAETQPQADANDVGGL